MAEEDFSEKTTYRREKINDFYHRLDRMYYRYADTPRSQSDYDNMVSEMRRDLEVLADDIYNFTKYVL